MRLPGLHIKILVVIGALLLVSMLLVSLVFIVFWQRNALRYEIHQDRVVLARILDTLSTKTGHIRTLPLDVFSLGDFYPAAVTGTIVLATPDNGGFTKMDAGPFARMMHEAMSAAETSRVSVVRYSGLFSALVGTGNAILVSACPVLNKGKVVGVITVGRSLSGMVNTLRSAVKMIFIYILMNLLILCVIGFFRMRKLVVSPIKRLTRLADQYTDIETSLFVTGSQGGEFGRLANSLNSMLSRIDRDRLALENNVRKLESANRQLQKQQQEMIRTEKLASVGRLAAGLAHEIGNPLGVVQGYLGLLQQDDIAEDERKDFACRSEQEICRIDGLVRQLLDFSRLSSTRKEKVALHSLLDNIVELVACQSCMRNVSIVKKMTARQDVVSADPDKMKQVFLNCLLNAADALVQSSCREKIIVITTRRIHRCDDDTAGPDGIEVAIKDNGVGIAEEDYPNIFDPFFTTKEPGKGTGLGLSVAYSIIEGCGGSMRIESKAGQGTTVFVELPLG